MDRFDLYELCTQTPERDVPLLRAIHGASPKRLGEDFAGTAALARRWVRAVRGGSAIALDRDREPLLRAHGDARVQCVVADVRRPPRSLARVDLLVALNFSICELHTRRELVTYLRAARRRLAARGCFVADLYGGDEAFTPGSLRERHRGPRGERIVYEFEQRSADALTGRVVDALHFQCTPRDGATTRFRDAFVYDWRLWSLVELREAMREAGFSSSEVFPRADHARDGRGRVHVRPLASSCELGSSWCVFVVGRR